LPDDVLPMNEADVEKRIKTPPEALPLLADFRQLLASQNTFEHQTLEQLAQKFITEKSIKPNQLIFPLRVATTGKSVGLGMFETLEILGKERVLRRIDRVVD
jgi:glutamyl-tRNA synthetase